MDRKEITLEHNLLDVVMMMTEKDEGAASAVADLLAMPPADGSGLMTLLHLDDMNIRGAQLAAAMRWAGGAAALAQAAKRRAPELVEHVNAEGRRRGWRWEACARGATRPSHGRPLLTSIKPGGPFPGGKVL